LEVTLNVGFYKTLKDDTERYIALNACIYWGFYSFQEVKIWFEM